MSLRGLTLSATFDYESDRDPSKGTPEATVFTLGPLDVFVDTYISDNAITMTPDGLGGQQARFQTNANNLDTVRFGLKGWRNFKDDAGNDIAFQTVDKILLGRKYTVVSDECLARIPIIEVRAMATEIHAASILSEDEAKNSGAAS